MGVTERSSSVEQTRLIGARLAQVSSPGDIYCIDGDLGTGKTEFVRGFVDALILGCDVRSPTFSIVNTYQTQNFPIYHFDFYRIEDQREFQSIGLDEYLNGDGVCLIEWGSMFPDVLPDYTRHIRLIDDGGSGRIIDADFLF
jgi:tRNA threonylcarbamoyladenosine biosynthesis protein TsaE